MEKEIALSIDQAMDLAIQVARRGAPYVSPNPLVGCVILDHQNKFLSSGYHEKYGEAHAEINALKNLSPEQLEGATVIVTLEPCAHVGKTGSCAVALSKYKIKKVVYGLQDPNPLVSGQGAALLTDAGIEVELYNGPFISKLENLTEVFLKNYRQRQPFIALKVASSLDGQMALKNGESYWITTSESREYVHELRSHYDAMIVGRKTIEHDDPQLNIRHPKINKKNKVIVFDPQGKLLRKIEAGVKFKFIETHAKQDIYFAVQFEMKTDYQTIQFTSMSDFLNQIFKLGIMSIFIEGGAGTYSSFLNQDLVDRLHLFMNTSIIGNDQGLNWSTGFGIQNLVDKKQLKDTEIKLFGQDIYLTGKF